MKEGIVSMKKTIAIIAGVIPAVSAVIAIHLGCDFGIVERDSYLTGRLS